MFSALLALFALCAQPAVAQLLGGATPAAYGGGSIRPVLSNSAPSFVAGTPYSFTPVILGGARPYSFALIGAPIGVMVDDLTGVVSGTPVTIGSATLRVTDAFGRIADFTIGAPANTMRVYSVSATEGYYIAPHPTLGAVAMHVITANNGDTSTPSNSVGVAFGAERIAGFRVLPSFDADPVTGYSSILSEDIGSQQMALRLTSNQLFAGIFHGGWTVNSKTVTPITASTAISEGRIITSGVLDFGGGNTMGASDNVVLKPDGSFQSTTSIAGGLIMDPVYLDMTIAEYVFDRAKALGDASWTKLISNTDGVTDADYSFAAADAVILRDRASGIEITVTDDVRANPRYSSKWVRRSPVGGSMRSKLYARLASATGVAMPAATVNRTITFAKTAPDSSPSWSAAVDGYDGMGKASGIVMPTLTSGVMRFTRSATTQTRAKFRMGVVPGGNYRLSISTAIAGGGATASSNGMTYAVTYDGIDSIQTPAPIVSVNYSTLTATGYVDFTAPAGTSVVQLIVQMTSGTAGHLVDLTSWSLASRP